MKLKENILHYIILSLLTYLGIGFLKWDLNIINWPTLEIFLTFASGVCAFIWYKIFLLIIKIRKEK